MQDLIQVVPGTPCLARYSQDSTIYRFILALYTVHYTAHCSVHCNTRAVVLKRDGHLAKVYYLDYGNSESLALHSIFCLPPSQLAVQMLSVRCRYGGHCHSPVFMRL